MQIVILERGENRLSGKRETKSLSKRKAVDPMKSGSMLILRRRMFFHHSASLHTSVFIHNGTFIYLHAVDGERAAPQEATRNLKPEVKYQYLEPNYSLNYKALGGVVAVPLCDSSGKNV